MSIRAIPWYPTKHCGAALNNPLFTAAMTIFVPDGGCYIFLRKVGTHSRKYPKYAIYNPEDHNVILHHLNSYINSAISVT
jgi:hypothetical protein